MIKTLCKIWLILRVYWSNFRNRSDIKDYAVGKVSTAPEMAARARSMYQKFRYKYDDFTELFDSMHTPAYCYKMCVTSILEDDCDGFHAALYHLAKSSGFECYLLTYISNPITSSHTILLFKYESRWYIIDYTTMLSYIDEHSIIEDLEDRKGIKIISWNLVEFNNNKFQVSSKQI